MKTFMKYVLVGVVSLAVGGMLGWQTFRGQTRQRVVSFDREQCHDWRIDLAGHEPCFELNFTPEGNTFNWDGKTGKIEEDLDSHLARIAEFTTSCWIVVLCNKDVTVQQLRNVDTRIRSFGFPSPLMLIEDNRDPKIRDGNRLFNEIRIGPSVDFN